MTAEDNMYQEAMSALQKGEKARARDLFTRLLKLNANKPEYWLWMSTTVDTPRERIICLKEALRLDPTNKAAHHGLVMLGAQAPDPSLAIPLRFQRRNWESKALLGVPQEKLIQTRSWQQYAMFGGAAVVVLALIIIGIVGRGRYIATGDLRALATYGPSMTVAPSGTPEVQSATPGIVGATPLWMLLKETYTPTPLYVSTRHPLSEAYTTAMGAYQRGDWNQMIAYLKQVLTIEPNSPDVYYYMGEAERFMKDTNAAIDNYNKAIQLNSGFAPAYLGRSRAYYASKPARTREGLADLIKSIQLDPNLADAYLDLTRINLSFQDSETALKNLQVLSTLTPDSFLLYYYSAQANLLQKNNDQALLDAEKANQLDQTNLDGYRLLGEAALQAGKPIESIDPLELYLRYEPKDAQVAAWLGGAYATLQETDKALAMLSQSIQLDDTQLDAYLQRGFLYYDQEKYDEAAADFSQAMKLDSKSYAANLGLGKTLFAKEQYGDAYYRFAAAETLAQLDAQRAEVFYWRAQTNEKKNDISAAVNDWNSLLDLPAESYPTDWADMAHTRLSALSTPTMTPLTPTLTLTRQPTLTRPPTLTPMPTQTRWPTVTTSSGQPSGTPTP